MNDISIRTKKDNYRLYTTGFYGTKLKTWDNLVEFLNSRHTTPVVLRYKRAGSSFHIYGIPPSEVEGKILEWERQGADRNLITINERAPDEELLVQGEVMRSEYYYTLTYSTEKLSMREGMKRSKYATGLTALSILRWGLSPSSYSDLEALFEIFPNAIVEFSAYNIDIGHIPGRNTIIWEVREY